MKVLICVSGMAKCEKENCLIDPCEYEVTGALCKAPTEGSPSRLNALQQLPGLLDNCRFYLNGQFDTPTKNDLTLWIRNGGGTILTRMPNPEAIASDQSVPYHANSTGKLSHCSHFVIYDPCAKIQPSILYNMNHLKTLPVQWLLACIEHFALVDPFLWPTVSPSHSSQIIALFVNVNCKAQKDFPIKSDIIQFWKWRYGSFFSQRGDLF